MIEMISVNLKMIRVYCKHCNKVVGTYEEHKRIHCNECNNMIGYTVWQLKSYYGLHVKYAIQIS